MVGDSIQLWSSRVLHASAHSVARIWPAAESHTPGRFDGVDPSFRPGSAQIDGSEHLRGIAGCIRLGMIDAFNSDAIPLHMLTREAVADFRRRLAPGGALALHISNRHLYLTPVVARLAADQHMEVRLRDATTGAVSLAAFRRPNRVTDRLSALLGDAAG